MEPNLVTAADLQGILEELKRREPLFHHPELGTTRKDVEAMTAPDFWEIGASGRRYSREYVLSVLAVRQDGSQPIDVWTTTDFHCRRLGKDVYLLTYTLFQGREPPRRSTIWQHASGRGGRRCFIRGRLSRIRTITTPRYLAGDQITRNASRRPPPQGGKCWVMSSSNLSCLRV